MTLISTSAMAEWTKVGESSLNGGYTAYADVASIQKAGDRAKMWALFDYQTVQKTSGVEYLSERIRREYDCKQKQMRKLAYKFFQLEYGRRRSDPLLQSTAKVGTGPAG